MTCKLSCQVKMMLWPLQFYETRGRCRKKEEGLIRNSCICVVVWISKSFVAFWRCWHLFLMWHPQLPYDGTLCNTVFYILISCSTAFSNIQGMLGCAIKHVFLVLILSKQKCRKCHKGHGSDTQYACHFLPQLISTFHCENAIFQIYPCQCEPCLTILCIHCLCIYTGWRLKITSSKVPKWSFSVMGISVLRKIIMIILATGVDL